MSVLSTLALLLCACSILALAFSAPDYTQLIRWGRATGAIALILYIVIFLFVRTGRVLSGLGLTLSLYACCANLVQSEV